jgi:cysteinyl-tRNA synthetase
MASIALQNPYKNNENKTLASSSLSLPRAPSSFLDYSKILSSPSQPQPHLQPEEHEHLNYLKLLSSPPASPIASSLIKKKVTRVTTTPTKEGLPSEISALMDKRVTARYDQRYKDADQIRDMLYEKGYDICDKQNTWKCRHNGCVGEIISLNEIEEDGIKPHDSTSLRNHIQNLFEIREDLRLQKNYVKADKYRNYLTLKHKVDIDDINWKWKCTCSYTGKTLHGKTYASRF